MDFLSGKRLVIFGCGYVGSAVAERALGQGMLVTALTRNNATAQVLRAKGVTTVSALLESDTWHAEIPRGADFVLNAVSAASATVDGYRQSYLDGARSILAWAGKGTRPIEALVYTSSTGVYPQGGGVRVDETAAVAGSSPSAEVLIEAEKLFLGATSALVRRAFVLRLAGIYGPGRHSVLDQLRAGAAKINGRGDHRLNLVHRDDIVGAIFAAFGAPPEIRGQVFNVSDGHPPAKQDFVAWLARKLGRDCPLFDPAAPSIRRGGAGVPDRVIDSGKIQSQLGWLPRYPDYRAGYETILPSAPGKSLPASLHQ